MSESSQRALWNGQKQEGYQQGNSFGAPYRYEENTWADDMEWAAAELYKCTGKNNILKMPEDMPG